MDTRSSFSPSGAVTLSVMLKTYNQAPFVGEAIESALAQRTTFPVEILVGDDRSTDGTTAVVELFARRHPGRIRVLARPTRVGMVRNTMDLYRASSGRYVAWLDGDDRWTSPDKLQRQVDELEAHPDLTMCYHQVEAVDRRGRRFVWTSVLPRRERYTLEDLLVMPPGMASSCVFRKILSDFPDWFSGLAFSDWPLQILHAERGPAAVLPEVLGLYRMNQAGAASLGFEPGRACDEAAFWAPHHLALYEVLRRHLGPQYGPLIDAELLRLGGGGAALRRLTARWPSVRQAVWRTIKRRPRAAAWIVGLAGRLHSTRRRSTGPRGQ
jgi:glycosyltransferase involved in cell wall biosynthesis